MSKKLISKNDLKQIAGSTIKNDFVFNIAYYASGFPQINRFYSKHLTAFRGIDFIDASLANLNIRYECPENDLKHLPKSGPFIVVSNHPFGFLDGLIMIRIFGEKFPEFRVLANYFLRLFEPVSDSFIDVSPFGNAVNQNIAGIKKALKHLQDGHPLGIFPSGEVATFHGNKLVDKEWEISAVKLIEKAGVPVIPVYFEGTNSPLFHSLGRINPYLRTISLPNEFLRKKNQKVFFRIGQPIHPEVYTKETTSETRSFLRSHVEAYMHNDKQKEHKNVFNWKLKIKLHRPEKIVAAESVSKLEKEILALPESQKLLTYNEYDVYFSSAFQTPAVLREIGRLREMTFRQVGEGTNRSIDLDHFDTYYEHLFVWNRNEREILGAYRLGRGEIIVPKAKCKGFYVNTLFELDDKLLPILERTIEMGRSFVVDKYQRKPYSLFLLWNGIMRFIKLYPNHQYLMGPVSISNNFSEFSKELIMAYIRKKHYNSEIAKYVYPKMEFKIAGWREADVENILETNKNDIKKLDNYIANYEKTGLRIPVLVKKYLSQNAKIVAFNVDPEFNFSLDGLMILDLLDLPKETIEVYSEKI